MSALRPSPVLIFLGRLLIAIGGLIAFLSGACSLVVTVANLGSLDAMGGLWLVVIFGAPPFLIGLALVWAGRTILRGARRVADTQTFS